MADEERRFCLFDEDRDRAALSEIARLILSEDVEALESLRGTQWALNQKVHLAEYSDYLVLEVALVHRRYKVLDYLLSKGVDLNVPGSPAMTSAVHTRDTQVMDRLIEAGADIRGKNNVGYDALDQIVGCEYFELIPYLESHGLSFRDHSGHALDSAVSDGHLDIVKYALESGANPNTLVDCGIVDTPLHSAVMTNNMDMVQLLLRHGADPLMANEYGQRPFHYALSDDKKKDLADYLRDLEPAELHDIAQNAALARAFNAPEELIARLSGSDLALGRARDGAPGINLLALKDIHVFLWQGAQFLALSRNYHDDYCLGEYVWCPGCQLVCAVDNEHTELFVLGTWSEFSADPDACLRRVW